VTRKRGPEAQVLAERAGYVRWRLLLRNLEFRAHVNELMRLRRTGVSGDIKVQADILEDKISERWELDSIPQAIHYPDGPSRDRLPELTSETVPIYERLFDSPHEDSPISPAVCWRWAGDEYTWEKALKAGRVSITADVQHPLDLIMPLIETSLREAVQDRRAQGGERPRPYKRHRLDKVEFQIEVYDRAARGEKFRVIAKALKQRRSTVKSAYATIARKIFFPDTSPTKKNLMLSTYDPNTHMQRCAICRTAERAEECCPATNVYIGQDHRSQREVTGVSTVSDLRNPADRPLPSEDID